MTYRRCFVNLWFGIVLLICWHTLCAGDEASTTEVHRDHDHHDHHNATSNSTDHHDDDHHDHDHHDHDHHDHDHHNASSLTEAAVMSLFDKYGQNGSLSFEGFKELLANLGLGKMHNNSEHHSDEQLHDHKHSRRKRSNHGHPHTDDEPHDSHTHQHSENCTGTDCLSTVVRCYFIFSERELTSAIMLSPVRLSSVCNVRAPYSAGWNFWQHFFAIWYLGHPLTSTENFTKIFPGNPYVGGLNARGVAKYSDFWHRMLYLRNGAR